MANVHHDIDRYLNGELSPSEMHALERKALDDPFLADALEGAAQIDAAEFSADMQHLQASLAGATKKRNKVVAFRVWSMRVAATLLLLAVSTFIILRITEDTAKEDQLAFKEEPTPQEPATLPEAPPAQDIDSTSPAIEAPPVHVERDREALSESHSDAPVEYTAPATSAAPEPAENIASTPAEDIAAAPVPEPEAVAPESISRWSARESKELQGFSNSANRDQGRKDKKARSVADTTYSILTPRTIRGKVTLADDGTGIPGVNVIVKGTSAGTVTNAEGAYQIRVEDEDVELAFSFIGMENKDVPTGGSNQVDVQLEPDVSQLSEVVVVGYGGEKKETDEALAFEFASPDGGRVAFKQYLEKSIHYPEQALANEIEGKVTVQFTVESSGQLSNFRVLRGLGYGCDEEVIRLIKNGPKWVPSKRSDEAVKDNVKVRLKFRLPKKKK